MLRQFSTYNPQLNLFKPCQSEHGGEQEVCKRVHLIWLGNILRETHIDRMNEWKKINPSYEINIWVSSHWHIDICNQMKDHPIVINDIATLSLPDHLATWVETLTEPGPTPPHYSAASDIYRFIIINQKGGWYADTDIIPFDLTSITINKELNFHIHATRNDNYVATLSPDCFASTPNSLLIQKALEFLESLGSKSNQLRFNIGLRSDIASKRFTMTMITVGLVMRGALGRILVDGKPLIEVYTNEDMKIHDTGLFDSLCADHPSHFEQSWIYSENTDPDKHSALPGLKLDELYFKIMCGTARLLDGNIYAQYIQYAIITPAYDTIKFSQLENSYLRPTC